MFLSLPGKLQRCHYPVPCVDHSLFLSSSTLSQDQTGAASRINYTHVGSLTHSQICVCMVFELKGKGQAHWSIDIIDAGHNLCPPVHCCQRRKAAVHMPNPPLVDRFHKVVLRGRTTGGGHGHASLVFGGLLGRHGSHSERLISCSGSCTISNACVCVDCLWTAQNTNKVI